MMEGFIFEMRKRYDSGRIESAREYIHAIRPHRPHRKR